MRETSVIDTAIERLRRTLAQTHPGLVREIRAQLGTDKDGQDAVFVTVVLTDRDTGDYRWEEVEPVERAIRKELIDMDPFRFPYVGFRLQSEAAELVQHGG